MIALICTNMNGCKDAKKDAFKYMYLYTVHYTVCIQYLISPIPLTQYQTLVEIDRHVDVINKCDLVWPFWLHAPFALCDREGEQQASAGIESVD